MSDDDAFAAEDSAPAKASHSWPLAILRWIGLSLLGLVLLFALFLVGLNSDALARRLGKGPGRPLNGELDRCAVLRGQASVDAVVLFDDDKPLRLLEQLRPDIYVKGGDYDIEQLEETPLVRSWGGRALALPFVQGRSTTALVQRIRDGG